MSLIDPSTRWWNRYRSRRMLAWIAGSVSVVAFFLVGWSAESPDSSKIAIYFPVGMLLMIGGAFLFILGTDSDADFNPRVVYFPIGAVFILEGVGQVAHAVVLGHAVPRLGLAFAGAGVLALLVIEVISRRVAGNRTVRRQVLSRGISARGRVTRARGYYVNESRVTRVTVEFTDQEGRTRWASQTVGGAVRVGERLTVRYLPGQMHRRAGVVIDGE